MSVNGIFHKALPLALCCVMVPVSLLAVEQIGTVIASAPFILRGAKISVVGVPSWPLLRGDEVATEDTSVAFAFRDGSRITLQPHSSARIDREGAIPAFHLLSCTAEYDLKTVQSVALFRNDVVEEPTATGSAGGNVKMRPGPRFIDIANPTTKLLKGQYTVGCKPALGLVTASGAGLAGGTVVTAGAATAGAGIATAGAATAVTAGATVGAATATVATATAVGVSAASAGVTAAVGVGTSLAGANAGNVSAATSGTPAAISASN